MFTAYHAIMFAVLLIGGAGVIFQASSGDDSLANNPIPVKATESKFDLNTYQVDSRFAWGIGPHFYGSSKKRLKQETPLEIPITKGVINRLVLYKVNYVLMRFGLN